MATPTSAVLRFSDAVVTVNMPATAGRKKIGDSLCVALFTYPSAVDGWSDPFALDTDACVFYGAGEYERGGVCVRGVGMESALQETPMQTTSWLIDADGIRVFVMGDVRGEQSAVQSVSAVGDVDVFVVFCVAGEKGRLSATLIASAVAAMQAQRVIPLGDDVVLRKKIAKEIGSVEDVVGKHVLKRKNLLDGVPKAILIA